MSRPHRTSRIRTTGCSRLSLRERFNSFARSRLLALTLNGYMIVAGFCLPLAVNSDKMSKESSTYATVAMAIVGLFVVWSNVNLMLSARKSFQERDRARQILTLRLTRAKTVFTVGGTAILGYIVGSGDVGLLPLLAVASFYIFGWILTSDAFCPTSITPVTQDEILDAAVAHNSGQYRLGH